MQKITELSHTHDTLVVNWSNGKTSKLLSLWLRDHCQMPENRNPANGQRIMNITDFPDNVSIKSAILRDDGDVAIQYQPAHYSVFNGDWLYEHAYDLHSQFDDRSAQTKTIWDKHSIDQNQIFHSYLDYCSNNQMKMTALTAFSEHGFIILTDVPVQPGTVLDVIKTFGFVRETNYGKLFDVKTLVNPNNLAFTNMGLGLHADNPYRDPVPTIQLLHCLENTVDGGESLLADGFKATQILRDESEESFHILASTWINFRFKDADTDLQARAPFIELNDHGHVVKVRFNNRSIAPINVDSKKMKAFYKAYRHYAQILERGDLTFEFKSKQGDLMLFDNARIFHARKAFSDSGSRWLQGAYADLDSIYSTLSILKRNC